MNKISIYLRNNSCFRNVKLHNNSSISCFERNIHKTAKNSCFFEKNRKGSGFESFPADKLHWTEHIKNGRKICFEQFKLLGNEVKELLTNDPKIYKDGDVDVFFRFDKKEKLEKWITTSDKVFDKGFSECKFELNGKGKGVFFGTVDTTPPKDGTNRWAGYCAIKSVRKTKSFFRMDWYDWTLFTHLVLRVKGDGRNYMINLGMGMYFDINWFDTYSYVMHTHGGPYWQTIKIPFSKFYLSSKGRLQDSQCPVPRHRIDSIGIVCAGVPGPFHLELDYIACEIDFSHTEEFAYELYKIPKEYVSS